MTDQADIRAGDRDRDQVAELLNDATGEGRLTFEELHERLDRAYAAKTMGELDALVADLPQRSGELEPFAGESADQVTITTKGGFAKKVGRWSVPPRVRVECTWGTAKVDFTGAVCAHREVVVELACSSRLGDIIVVVPHGWQVRTDEVTGTLHNKPSQPPAPDGVVVRLTGWVRGDVWVLYRNRRG